VTLSGKLGFLKGQTVVSPFDAGWRQQVEAQHLRDVKELLLSHYTKPELIISCGTKYRVEITISLM